MDKDWKRIEQHYGYNPKKQNKMSAEREQKLKEALKMMQKKQEERRRLKAEDPEAYRKLKEKEDQEMREYTDSVPFWD